MKPRMLCLLLLPACSWLSPPYEPIVYEYALTWICRSPEGCERTEEVKLLDRMDIVNRDCHFTSTQDASFSQEAQIIYGDMPTAGCSQLHFLSLFGHELEPGRLCGVPGGFELELAIPNADPTTSSQWLVEAWNVDLL